MDDGADDYLLSDSDGENALPEPPGLVASQEMRQEKTTPRFVRHNSTSTVKASTTMSKPNNEATIEVVANIIHGMISIPPCVARKKHNVAFDLRTFNDPAFGTEQAPVRGPNVLYTCSFSDSDDSSISDLVYEEKTCDDLLCEQALQGLSLCSDDEGDGGSEIFVDPEFLSEEENDENSALNQNSDNNPRLARRNSDKENAYKTSMMPQEEEEEEQQQPLPESRALREVSLVENQRLTQRYAEFLSKHKQGQAPQAPMPTNQQVRDHLHKMFKTAQCSEECNIICLIYLKRVVEFSGDPKGLTPYNWKVLTMTAMLLASKVWDDLSMVNEDFSCFLPHSLAQINAWEVKFLSCIKFNVHVGASQYASAYFELRKISQLAGYEELPDRELTIEQATQVNALVSVAENRSKQMQSHLSSPPGAAAFGDEVRSLRRVASEAGPNKTVTRYVID